MPSKADGKEDGVTRPSEMPANLKCIRQLGKGAFGTVYLCEDTDSGEQVAVKHVKDACRQGKSILREIRLLARLHHENLLHLIDMPAVNGPDFQDIFLVLPYMPADLHKVIHGKQSLSDKHVQAMMCQILRGLAFLHASGVAHRDLKPANILLQSDCSLKICDFGLARGDMPDPESEEQEQACGVLTEYVVTRWYRAPEVMLLPKQYTSALDLWSAGCILFEIVGRKVLFPGKNHVDMVRKIAEVLGNPPDSEIEWLPKSTDAYRFLRQVCPQGKGNTFENLYPSAKPDCLALGQDLLKWDPDKRLTATEALLHPYLKSFKQKDTDLPYEPFDWSFDNFKRSSANVRERLYQECSRFHPEILSRDKTDTPKAAPEQESKQSTPRGSRRSSTPPLVQGSARSSTPPVAQGSARSSTPPAAQGSAPRGTSKERDKSPARRSVTPPKRSGRSVTPPAKSGESRVSRLVRAITPPRAGSRSVTPPGGKGKESATGRTATPPRSSVSAERPSSRRKSREPSSGYPSDGPKLPVVPGR